MRDIDLFASFLRDEKGQTDSTIRTNLKLINKIFRECNPLSPETIRPFVIGLKGRRASPSYIKQHVSIIRQWGECFSLSQLADYPYPEIKYHSTFKRGLLSDSEVLSFLALPNPHKQGVYHDRYAMWILFFAILFYHGMRTIEIASLEIDQIDFGLNAIIIPPEKSKTHTGRDIPLSPVVRPMLEEYISSLKGSYLFPSFHTSTTFPHVQENDWRGFFNKQKDKLSIKRANLTAYSGRHTYGSRQVAQDVNLFKIKELMGHKRIETTMKYLQTNLSDLQKIQDNDRLLIVTKNGIEILEDIEKKQEEIYLPYKDKVIKSIIWKDDELIVKFKLKKMIH